MTGQIHIASREVVHYLKQQPGWIKAKDYDDGHLLKGEVGMIWGVRIVEAESIPENRVFELYGRTITIRKMDFRNGTKKENNDES